MGQSAGRSLSVNTQTPLHTMAAYTKTNTEITDEKEQSEESVGGLRAMSPIRLASFVLSLLLSVLTTSLFLWALPCDTFTCTLGSFNETQSRNTSKLFSSYDDITPGQE